jgi:hypothetical protein
MRETIKSRQARFYLKSARREISHLNLPRKETRNRQRPRIPGQPWHTKRVMTLT